MTARRALPGAVAALALALAGCAGGPPLSDEQARRLGLTRQVLDGAGFRHVSYHNDAEGDTLHVYLDGDGTPWLNRSTAARDPTPRNPLVLELMALDRAPSLYLGRPCYHGFYADPGCTPLLWTGRRYGDEVVASMAAALRGWVGRGGYSGLVFLGYSGGGALAMLLAERFEQTRALVTIAGNLDPARWAAWHDYSPLIGSLNPANRPPLPAGVWQLHLSGGRDNNVLTRFVRPVVSRQRCAELIVVGPFDHRCCWPTLWPTVLEALDRGLESETARTSCRTVAILE